LTVGAQPVRKAGKEQGRGTGLDEGKEFETKGGSRGLK